MDNEDSVACFLTRTIHGSSFAPTYPRHFQEIFGSLDERRRWQRIDSEALHAIGEVVPQGKIMRHPFLEMF
jgi:hypothetical protein